MYEISEQWAPYYAELDPEERRKIFDRLADPEDASLDFCRRIYAERYQDPKHPGRAVDNWLWKCVYLPGLYKRRRSLKRQVRREAAEMLAALHLEAPEALTEGEKAVLYHEFRNTARRYLSTCRSGQYARKFLGILRASEEEKRKRACEEIWAMSRGIALASGQEEKLRLWCDAFYAELLEFDPEGREYYETMDAAFQQS